MIARGKSIVTPEQILHASCELVGVHPDLVRLKRERNLVLLDARGCFAVVSRTLLHVSYPELARLVGRPHSSVIHAANYWRNMQRKGKPVATRHGYLDRQEALDRVIATLRSHPGIYVPNERLDLTASSGRYWSVGKSAGLVAAQEVSRS